MNSNNYVENIHDETYERKFNIKCIDEKNMIYDSFRDKEYLNGEWNFQIDPYDTCLRSKWYEEIKYDQNGNKIPVDYEFDKWDTIKVPSCYNIQDKAYLYYEGPVIYTRRFNYENKGENRVFIKFGAVNYTAKIFLNKNYLGYHNGGSTPFYVEVTGLLNKENRLIVVADNTRKEEYVPNKNTDWFNYGGIYRDVELIRLPKTFIKEFFIFLEPRSGFKKINVYIKVDGEKTEGQAIIKIDELNIYEKINITNCEGYLSFEAKPELWSPNNPKLYDVEVFFENDSIKDKVGFREIITSGTDVYLNGEKIYLKGVSCHEESVKNGKAISDEEMIENFKIAKEMNCNFMRLAHYPHTEKAARLADELGILLWEEIPVYWAIDFSNDKTFNDAKNQLTELIKRDRNRASVIIWSIGNENNDSDERLNFMSLLVEEARKLDRTRLISAACLIDNCNLVINDRLEQYLDIIGINEYYGWYDPDLSKLEKIFKNSNIKKPVIISEFGADAKAGERGTVNDMGTEEYQLSIYKQQISLISKINYICGMSPWILYDFRCPRRTNNFQKMYNIKGLLSADKKYKKLSYYFMKSFYETLN